MEKVKLERLKRLRSKIHKSRTAESPLPLTEKGELVDNILSMFASEIQTPNSSAQRWNALSSTRLEGGFAA
jgi:hypothetical protein